MAHPQNHEIYPLGTVVQLKKTHEFAIIRQHVDLMGSTFLHYLGEIEGRGEDLYCLIHDEVELEALPPENEAIYFKPE
jgi:hypothetical protein